MDVFFRRLALSDRRRELDRDETDRQQTDESAHTTRTTFPARSHSVLFAGGAPLDSGLYTRETDGQVLIRDDRVSLNPEGGFPQAEGFIVGSLLAVLKSEHEIHNSFKDTQPPVVRS